MKIYLIAHTNPDGTGVAQRMVRAKTEDNARKRFIKEMPLRCITLVGVRQ